MTKLQIKQVTAKVKKESAMQKRKHVRKEDKKLFVRRMQTYLKHRSKLEVEGTSGPLRIKTMVEIMITMLMAALKMRASRKISHMSNLLSSSTASI